MAAPQPVANTIAKSKDVVKWYASIVRKRKWTLLLVLLLGIASTIISTIYPLYYKQIVDIITGYQGTTREVMARQLLSVVGYLGLVIVLRVVLLRCVSAFLGTRTNLEEMWEILFKSFQGLMRHSEQFFAERYVGALTNKMMRLYTGWLNIRSFLVYDLQSMVIGLTFPLIFLWYQSWVLGVGMLVRGVLYVGTLTLLHRRRYPYVKESTLAGSQLNGKLSDVISNNQVVRVSGTFDQESQRRREAIQEYKDITRKSRRRKSMVGIIDGFISSSFDLGMVAIAVYLWLQGEVTPGVIVMVLTYTGSISSRLQTASNLVSQWYDLISNSGEMVSILDLPYDVVDGVQAPLLAVKKWQISFEDVSFSYKDKIVMDNFSLSLKPGEKIALVWPSGAGKSTITKLLLRLYDIQSGAILIDGQNIAEVQQDSLRSAIAMVPQDITLFHRSIFENIAHRNPKASRKKVIEAAKMAQCHDFIMSLPDGYDSLVGERGIKLSGGERQRIAIARAILAQTKIVIMDEATSSLDSENEKLIQDAVHTFLQHKTALVIAHRLSTIRQMDRIVVIDGGRISEQGTHDELLKNPKGLYKKLRDLQTLSE